MVLVAITLLLRPSCHLATSQSIQACDAYHLLAILMDAMIAVLGMGAIGVCWANGRRQHTDDLESQTPQGVEDYFVGSETTSLLRARAYTFGVRELPFRVDYGTIGVDPEVQAIMTFYRFPVVDLPLCDGGILESGSQHSYESSQTSPRSLQKMSPRPLEEDEGWTKWRWRQSTVGASISPTGATIVY